jgi:hypothetical protein
MALPWATSALPRGGEKTPVIVERTHTAALVIFGLISNWNSIAPLFRLLQKTCADSHQIRRPVKSKLLAAHGNAVGLRP